MKYVSLAVLVVGLALVSCGRPYTPGADVNAPQEKEKVLLLDHGLRYYLKVVKQAADRMPGGQLQVKVDVENEEDKDVWCDIQLVFRGQDGFELEKTAWEPLLFHRRTVTSIQRNSLNPQAADYLLQIRNVK